MYTACSSPTSPLSPHHPSPHRPPSPTRLSNALSQQEQELMRLRAAFSKLRSQGKVDSQLGLLQADLDKACDGVIGLHTCIEKTLYEVFTHDPLRHTFTHSQVHKHSPMLVSSCARCLSHLLRFPSPAHRQRQASPACRQRG